MEKSRNGESDQESIAESDKEERKNFRERHSILSIDTHSQSFRFCFSKAFSIQIIMKINEIIWLKALEKIMQKQTILVWLRIRVAKTNTQTHTRTHVHYLHGGKTWRRRSTKNNSDHYDSFQLSFLFLFLLKRNNRIIIKTSLKKTKRNWD